MYTLTRIGQEGNSLKYIYRNKHIIYTRGYIIRTQQRYISKGTEIYSKKQTIRIFK